MNNDKKEIKKPLPCNQQWDEMLPVEGGRICTGCLKLVTDFRKYSWADIENVHTKSSIHVCGIYSEKQLMNWGEQVSESRTSFPKLLTLSASLLALTELTPIELKAQTNVTQQQAPTNKQPETNQTNLIKPTRKFITGTIEARQPDGSTKCLKDARVYLSQDTLHLKAITDTNGNFAIEITNQYDKLPTKNYLLLIHPHHLTKYVEIDKSKLTDLNFIMGDKGDKNVTVKNVQSHTSYYYAMPPRQTKPAPVKKDTIVKQPAEKKRPWQMKRKKQ